MIYPKTDFCPFNEDTPQYNVSPERNANNYPERDSTNCPGENMRSGMENKPTNSTQSEMMKQIMHTEFALVDLNLFLDTHPDCREALELFTKLAASLKSLKADYETKFGPLYAWSSRNETPFQWVEQGRKWPWEI